MDRREDEIFGRVGKFTIPMDYIDEFPHAMMQILSNFLIVRAETTLRSPKIFLSFHYERAVEYIGYSMLFDILDPSAAVPTYVWKMTSNGLIVRNINLAEVGEVWHTSDERTILDMINKRTILDMINKKEQVTIYSRKLLLPKKKRG